MEIGKGSNNIYLVNVVLRSCMNNTQNIFDCNNKMKNSYNQILKYHA